MMATFMFVKKKKKYFQHKYKTRPHENSKFNKNQPYIIYVQELAPSNI